MSGYYHRFLDWLLRKPPHMHETEIGEQGILLEGVGVASAKLRQYENALARIKDGMGYGEENLRGIAAGALLLPPGQQPPPVV